MLTIYKLTKVFPKEEKYGIADQLRRSTSSITANIAEGWGRYHFKDRMKFYYNARGSICETLNFTILTKDLHYISQETYNELCVQIEEGLKLINGLIRYLETKSN